MRKATLMCISLLALTLVARAQDTSSCGIPVDLGGFAAKAIEVVDINMDESMLKFAGNFLNQDKADESSAKKILSGLRGVCVRSYKFGAIGQYAEEEVEMLRAQFPTPAWSSMVKVRNKKEGENVDVMIRLEEDMAKGLVVIAAEPKEFTFVYIDGTIDPSQFSKIGGQFGIPKVEMPPGSKPAAGEESK